MPVDKIVFRLQCEFLRIAFCRAVADVSFARKGFGRCQPRRNGPGVASMAEY
jgi:hypothetical protein